MPEQKPEALRCDPGDLRQAMSIHTKKITDSCRDKDCIEDLRVYLTKCSQQVLDTAASARVRCAELLYTDIEVEPVAFDGHHYCIDVTFYYRILADAVVGAARPAALYGLAVFSKRAVLCGEDSRTHIFRSDTRLGGPDGIPIRYANLPTAVVEVTDTNSRIPHTDLIILHALRAPIPNRILQKGGCPMAKQQTELTFTYINPNTPKAFENYFRQILTERLLASYRENTAAVR